MREATSAETCFVQLIFSYRAMNFRSARKLSEAQDLTENQM